MPDVSVVIRAYNEAGPLRTVFERVGRQEHALEVELVVVDNGSVDDTAAVARAAGAHVVTLPQEQFSYPRSLNVGIARASAPVVVALVAHAYPVGRRWLAAGVRHFEEPSVAGVYSNVIPHARAGLLNQRLYWPAYLRSRVRGVHRDTVAGAGSFGATNLALRRSLWVEHPFDEQYGAGGEDQAWATWALEHGYAIVCDPAFLVRHSHPLRGLRQMRAQRRLWATMAQPRPFDRGELAFRTEGEGGGASRSG